MKSFNYIFETMFNYLQLFITIIAHLGICNYRQIMHSGVV